MNNNFLLFNFLISRFIEDLFVLRSTLINDLIDVEARWLIACDLC